jgi:protein O-GlcNAc transferase
MNLSPRMSDATASFLQGNLQKADLLCRRELKDEADPVPALLMLARIAEHLGQHGHARGYMTQAKVLNPALEVHSVPGSTAPTTSTPQPRYLLIKAWGYGFWSDIDHVYGALLLAEITGRVPVVKWGNNSLFRDADTDNAFESFFEPISALQWNDLLAPGLSYFPTKWHPGNLTKNEVRKWSGDGSRLSGIYLLNRSENVVVSDYHIKINDLMPWIPEGHPFQQMSRSEIYRHLNEKYFRLRPHLTLRIDTIWREKMAHKNWLAVHVRGTDKVFEVGNLNEVNKAYAERIDQILNINPTLNIFLMTDSKQVVDEFKGKFTDRLLTMDCHRGGGTTGIHLEGNPRTELGEQVITDAYLASRCEFFLGNGGSNVSTCIRHLRHWVHGTYFLIGHDFLGTIDTSLHDW